MTKFSRIHKNRKMDLNRPPVGPLELIICVPGGIFYRGIALWHQNCDLKHPECVYDQFSKLSATALARRRVRVFLSTRYYSSTVLLHSLIIELQGVQDFLPLRPRLSALPPPGLPKRSFFSSFFRCVFKSIFSRSWLDFPPQLASQNPPKSIKNRCQEAIHLGLQFLIDF